MVKRVTPPTFLVHKSKKQNQTITTLGSVDHSIPLPMKTVLYMFPKTYMVFRSRAARSTAAVALVVLVTENVSITFLTQKKYKSKDFLFSKVLV